MAVDIIFIIGLGLLLALSQVSMAIIAGEE